MQLLRSLASAFRFSTSTLRTQVFSTLTNTQLATPELMRLQLIKRIPFHSRVSQVSLYHGKRVRHAVKSCFSEKKTKKFKRVHKIKRTVYSEILGRKLFVRLSNKANRTLEKYGSFDRYILLTSPRRMDSKMGEYYREIMMRKVNDPDYRVPYVLGSGTKERIRKFHRYYWTKESRRLVIPKDYKKRLVTMQRKFGTSVDQFADQDYQKFLQVQKLKKLWGKDIDTRHPLLLQIQSKLNIGITPEQKKAMEQRGEQYKQEYLNHPKNRELRQQSYEYNQRQSQKQNAKLREAWLKHQMFGQAEAE